jgi:transposase
MTNGTGCRILTREAHNFYHVSRRHPVEISIGFCRQTVKRLETELHAAFQRGDTRRIKRTSALLLLADHRPADRVAARLGVSPSTIYQWQHDFLLRRWSSLASSKPSGRPARLTPRQKWRLKTMLQAGPEHAGFSTGCWNSALVQTLIEREFGVCYSVHYVCELLRNLGFSYQKARFVSDHLDEERRQHWLQHAWPAILRTARRRKALLLFGDEASFAQWGSLGYTWAPRGQQPTVKTCGKRKGYKVMGVVDYLSGRIWYQGHTGRFNAAQYCAFLAWLLEQTARPIMLVQDGARYHTAVATQRFVASHAERLTVHQLPSYSPDYNPIEHLWRNLKRAVTHNRYFPTFEALQAAVDAGLAVFQADPSVVKRLMGDHLEQAVRLAKAA